MANLMLAVALLALAVLAPGRAAGAEPALGRGETTDAEQRRSARLHNYNNWELGDTSEAPDVLHARLRNLAQRDSVTFGEPMEWPNDVPGWRKPSPLSLKALNAAIPGFTAITP
ncbi:MAG: hypothetical protein GTN93_12685 [Anaerolineae bacterium]|nr:hypothetical protein [Anaerolineae bacterium]